MDVNSIYLYYIYVLYFLCLCALYVSVCLLFILFDVCTVFTETNSCCWCKILLGNKSLKFLILIPIISCIFSCLFHSNPYVLI